MNIFFAAPYTNMASPHDKSDYGWVPDDYVDWLAKIVKGIESMGHSVYVCHKDDHEWGKSFPKICELALKQFKKITTDTDVMVAYFGNPPSSGVGIEIGYAISSGVRVIIIKKPNEKITSLVDGLNSVSSCKVIEFNDDKHLLSELEKALIPVDKKDE